MKVYLLLSKDGTFGELCVGYLSILKRVLFFKSNSDSTGVIYIVLM